MSKDQIKELAETYRPEQNQPELSVKTFLRDDQVKTMANSELMKRYVELGYTIQAIADKKDEIYRLSLENKQLSTALKTIESIENNIYPQSKVKITEERRVNSNLTDNYNKAVKETKRVTVEQETKPQIESDEE